MGNGKLKMGVNAAVGAAMLWLLFVTHAVFAGPFEDSALAYAQKDYATALRLLRPLADQGNALGQFNPGNMYYNGQGASQDYAQAHMWFNLAAAGSQPEDAETQRFAADNRNKLVAETASRPIHFCTNRGHGIGVTRNRGQVLI